MYCIYILITALTLGHSANILHRQVMAISKWTKILNKHFYLNMPFHIWWQTFEARNFPDKKLQLKLKLMCSIQFNTNLISSHTSHVHV